MDNNYGLIMDEELENEELKDEAEESGEQIACPSCGAVCWESDKRCLDCNEKL